MIKSEFNPYWNSQGLLNPYVSNGTGDCDNGVMFLCEASLLSGRLGLNDGDSLRRVRVCIDSNGLLHRIPLRVGPGQQESVDNYYALLSFLRVIKDTQVARGILWNLIRYFGCLNNVSPGQWTKVSFLARQLQLVCCVITVSYPSRINLLHWLIRLISAPLYWYSALVIGISCINKPVGDSDSRRLNFHVGSLLGGHSVLCHQAFKFWAWRQRKKYGVDKFMAKVAEVYYSPHDSSNPWAKNWIGKY